MQQRWLLLLLPYNSFFGIFHLARFLVSVDRVEDRRKMMFHDSLTIIVLLNKKQTTTNNKKTKRLIDSCVSALSRIASGIAPHATAKRQLSDS